jgi:transposase InsO family protein
MKAAVERVVRCCIRCQKNRRRKNLPKPPLKPMVYQRLLECIQIDLTFLKEDRGYIGVLTVIDCCSKYFWAYPIRSKRTGPIALKLFKLFSKEGDPKYLQSDNGKEFVSKCIKALTKLLKAEHKRSRPKHPQTNGTVESVNKNLKAMLREHMANTGCKSWATALTSTVRQYNDTPHSALPGLTPFQRHRMMVPKLDTQRK